MAYIGKSPVIGNFVKLDAITAVNGQAAYTMQNGGVNFTSYDNVNQFLVSLNGILQSPTDSFTVSGSTLTFASNLSTGDVIDFVLVLGNSLDIGTPSDNTVTAAKIGANAVTNAKLNNDIISGATELASEPADTDEFLVSDAGTLKRIDYSLIKATPGLTKLASTDVTSGTAAIVFDSSVVTAFDNYLIILNGIKTASNSANGTIMFSTDNGSSFIGRTRFTANTSDLNAGTVGHAHTGTFSLNSVTNPVMWDNHSTEPLCGQFYFQNCNPLNDNTYSVHANYISSYTNQGGIEYQQRGAVMYDVTAGQQINYFKVVNATQNIDEGRAILYGFNQ